MNNGCEIAAIGSARDSVCSYRIGVGYRNSLIHICEFDASKTSAPLVVLYEICLTPTIPTALHFSESDNQLLNSSKVYVFGQDNGRM